MANRKTRAATKDTGSLIETFYDATLVDQDSLILFINAAAEVLIRKNCVITIVNDRIRLVARQLNGGLQKLIHKACDRINGKRGGAIRIGPKSTPGTLNLLVNPLNSGFINPGSIDRECVLVILNDETTPGEYKPQRLQPLYGFTTAESKLAAEISNGTSIADYAETFKLSRNTLKSQLRACYHKTGVRNQKGLIRLISNGPANILKVSPALKEPLGG